MIISKKTWDKIKNFLFVDENELLLLNTRLTPIKRVHGYFGFADGSQEIAVGTVNTWTKITNATDDLFQNIQTNAGIVLDDDDFHFNIAEITGYYGHMKFDFKIVGHGGNNVDFDIEIYNITQSKSLPVKVQITTGGANNRVTGTGIAYDMESNFGDKYKMRIQNTTNGTSFTVTNAAVWIELSHYLPTP
jgi:hypothetical protein